MEQRDPFALPPPEKLREIAAKQDERAKEIKLRRAQQQQAVQRSKSKEDQSNAAQLIQKNYRGYRDRRALQGYGLDPTTRWIEV